MGLQLIVKLLGIFSINPRSAEQTWALTLLLAHNFTARCAVVNQSVHRGLAIANLPASHQNFAKITLLNLNLVLLSSKLFALKISLLHHLPGFLLIDPLLLNTLNVVFYELLGLFQRVV